MNDWAEFRHFKYVLAVLEHGGFRAASEHLNTAEPNLSVQARQFQEMFGIQLFRKGKDGRIQLTETGIAFKPIARGVLEAREEAIEALLAVQRGDLRSLSIGSSPLVDPGLFHTVCEMHREIVPNCTIRPIHGDAVQLVEELVTSKIDAALLTLPISEPRLHIETVMRNRLVACLRVDHPLAGKASLQPTDLQDNPMVLYDPQRHPEAHARLMKLLEAVGVQIHDHSRASHPTEMHDLVKAGYGLALIRDRTALNAELTTRPIAGTDWTVDTAFVYNRQAHPKTFPVLLRNLKRKLAAAPAKLRIAEAADSLGAQNSTKKRPRRSEDNRQTDFQFAPPGSKSP